MIVHTLTCEEHLWFAIPCLKSLLAFCEEPVKLVIHDDGSVTPASAELLAAAFPDSAFVPRSSSDAEMGDALARFPGMAKARTYLPHVLKLSDVSLLHPGSELVRYVDADILFQRRFRHLFPGESAAGAFMMDSRNSFAAHPGDIWPLGPLRLPSRLNSGLFWIRRDQLDFDRMEYLFRRWGSNRIRKYHGWFEQTVWADQAWRARCSLFDPAQFGTATPGDTSYRTLIGAHFVTPVRNMLKAALQSARAASATPSDGSTEDVRLCPPQPYGLIGACVDAANAACARFKQAGAR